MTIKRSILSGIMETFSSISIIAMPFCVIEWFLKILIGIDKLFDLFIMIIMLIVFLLFIFSYYIIVNLYYSVYPTKITINDEKLIIYRFIKKEIININDIMNIKKIKVTSPYTNYMFVINYKKNILI